jgi:hypothetical protein
MVELGQPDSNLQSMKVNTRVWLHHPMTVLDFTRISALLSNEALYKGFRCYTDPFDALLRLSKVVMMWSEKWLSEWKGYRSSPIYSFSGHRHGRHHECKGY